MAEKTKPKEVEPKTASKKPVTKKEVITIKQAFDVLASELKKRIENASENFIRNKNQDLLNSLEKIKREF